jgi:hypothetical protein
MDTKWSQTVEKEALLNMCEEGKHSGPLFVSLQSILHIEQDHRLNYNAMKHTRRELLYHDD